MFIARSDKDFGDLARCGRELADSGAHHLVRERQMKIADRTLDLRIHSRLQSSRMPRNDPAMSGVFVGIGFGVLVSVMNAAVVEQRAIAFRDRFQFAEEIGELLDMPAAD